MENLAHYIIQASFSQERMTYLPEESQIIYRSKDNRQKKTFDAFSFSLVTILKFQMIIDKFGGRRFKELVGVFNRGRNIIKN